MSPERRKREPRCGWPCFSAAAARGRKRGLTGYNIEELIDAGGYAQVRACTQKSTGERRALKVIDLTKKNSSSKPGSCKAPKVDQRTLALTEETLWRECSGHEHIVLLH